LRPVLLLLIALLSSDHARSNSLTQNFRLNGALRWILQDRQPTQLGHDRHWTRRSWRSTERIECRSPRRSLATARNFPRRRTSLDTVAASKPI